MPIEKISEHCFGGNSWCLMDIGQSYLTFIWWISPALVAGGLRALWTSRSTSSRTEDMTTRTCSAVDGSWKNG